MSILLLFKMNEIHFSQLDPDKLIETIRKLELRIESRFPDSGLKKVCSDFLEFAKEIQFDLIKINTPIWYVRLSVIASGLLLTVITVFVFYSLVKGFLIPKDFSSSTEMIQGLEAGTNELIFFGLAFIFLKNLERNVKRNRTLKSIQVLRNFGHVVDMHQLTKDPTAIPDLQATGVSPARITDHYQLTRYLDYCSEMLSLISKMGALYSQYSKDEVVLENVNDLSDMCQGVSSKIWQKIMIMKLGRRED